MASTRRKATEEEKERLRRGIKARQDAVNTLMERHRAEFDELHAANRVAAGLSARSAGPSKEQLAERIRKQEEKLEKWKRELQLAG